MFVSVPFAYSNREPEKNTFCADILYRVGYNRIARQCANAKKQQFLVSLTWGAKCAFTPESSVLDSRAVRNLSSVVVPDVQQRKVPRVASLSGITAAAPSMVQPSSAGMGLF
ncbi:hypothetical protein DEU29_101253 [Idiomarina aquatica]|uniref:Uncharacterized protein n=1 Tax=Idiomarina aquatica TaxID=1327752 RepID=A0A4V3CQA8_9GAMM|nr:hypothetical protein [Idiomarina aquatica]TDP40703.1 hypothetical protein DEU29_101253 [Idiomarina aquatica]